MKRKYFFGILLSLFLLCGGVFLLTSNSFSNFNGNQNLDNENITNAVTITANLNICGRDKLGLRAQISVCTKSSLNLTGSTSKVEIFDSESQDGQVIAYNEGKVSYHYRSIDCYISNYTNQYPNVPEKIKITHGDNISICDEQLKNETWYEPGKQEYGTDGDCTYEVYMCFNTYITLNQANATSNGNTSTIFSTDNEEFYWGTGASMTPLSLPTRTGYTFQGYYTGQNGTGQQWVTANGYPNKTYLNRNTAKPTTLYAHWTPNTYTVTLNQNGGSNGTGSVTATYDSAMPSITTPTIGGYRFLGYWDTSASSGGTQYYNANGGSVRNWDKTSNTTLYARWEIYNYKIDINFYQPNGSTQNGGTFDLYKKLSGGSESLVASGATNEVQGQQYLQYNGQFILKKIMPNAGTYITRASLSSTSNNGTIAASGDPIINTITYTANQTGQPSGGWDNAIQIYTANNTLTATLKYQDGATADAKRSATYNSNKTSLLTLPSSPTRTGYRFLGWSLTKNDTGVYYTPESDFNDVVINGKKVSDPNVKNLSFNLYAIWQVNTYTTTLNDGTGAVTNFADMMITNYNYTYSSNEYCHTVNGVTITYENGTGTLTLNGTPTNAFTIFINTDLSFKQNEQYSVKYTKQEGSMTGGGAGCFVLEICDENWANLSTRNHLDFQMNNSSGEAKLTVNESGETNGKGLRLWFWYNVNATPARVFNNFKIKITLEKLGENQSVIKTGKVTYDSQLRGVSIPSKIGHTFNGYYNSQSGGKQYYKATGVAITKTWKETNNITLYARWTPHSYTIVFNGNGSTSGSTSSKKATYDSDVELSTNGFKRTGYVFTGWNTKSDGKGKSYLDKATVNNLTSADGATVTLYAQWEETWANHASSSLETTEINGVTYNVIASAEDLAYLSKQSISSTLLGKYIQTADIDLSDYTWLPIGSEHAFCGEYLGQGHKITGLHTSDAKNAKGVYLQTYGGLFGKLGENSTTDASANIVGVYITDCLVYGQYSGAIAGFSDVDSVNIEACIEACILENVKIYGNTTASFVGSSSAGQIKDCLLISSNISTANTTTRGFYTGSMTVNSSYYMNGTTPTRFYTSGASSDYSNWVTGVFKYPLPKALIWYPGA